MRADTNGLTTPDIPRRLLDRATEGRLVLFVGSGTSLGAAGGPTWDGLLEELVRFADDERIRLDQREELEELMSGPAADMILAADYLRKQVGDAEFGSFIRKRFGHARMRGQEVHKVISELPLAGVVTTNFDTLVEGHQPDWIKILPHDDDPMPPEDARWIVKLHGCATKPTSVVLAAGDYDELMADQAFQSALEYLYRGYTFLFVGFGLQDPDTVSLLKALRWVSRGRLPHHFALVAEADAGEIRSDYLKRTLGVRVLPYVPSDASHPEVTAFLANLAAQSGKRHVQRTLLVIKACTPDGHHRVLVCRGTAGWTHTDGQRCFMLPNVPSPTDGDDFRAQIAGFLGVPEGRLRVERAGDGFSTGVRKPEKVRSGETGRYTFQVVTVAFDGDTEGLGSALRTLQDRAYVWKSLPRLRAHEATAALNDAAFEYLADQFGSCLDTLPDAVELREQDAEDPGEVDGTAAPATA